jgi:hypothetical protein
MHNKVQKKEKKASRRERTIAILIVFCLLIIAGWEIAAKLAARPFDELLLKAEDFSGFLPSEPGWSIQLEHVKVTPTDPTAISYALRHPSTAGFPAGVIRSRIVHGYNMVDCMRIKQYAVELLADTRQAPVKISPELNLRPQQLPDFQFQLWKLTSAGGEVSVWATSMLRATDFALTAIDTRDMAFPRVGTPDSPSWQPSGIKLSSFKHPIKNSRNAVRARWNASRCDPLTFLRLRQPAWASSEMLTMVTEYHGQSVKADDIAAVSREILAAHQMMLHKFQQFWQSRPPAEDK